LFVLFLMVMVSSVLQFADSDYCVGILLVVEESFCTFLYKVKVLLYI
jgi:hypothetical protein